MIEQTANERWNGYDAFDMYCDFCDEYQNFDDMDLRTMIKDARGNGWTMKKDENGDWQHKCPACSNTIE